jgi:hypothetical protein
MANAGSNEKATLKKGEEPQTHAAATPRAKADKSAEGPLPRSSRAETFTIIYIYNNNNNNNKIYI